ncbi:MFS transporter [Lentzea terrae]|uniref:MFS transporter n=1 Tax=Lentzea terrae TaxID=2200761 RepID=UPI000DD4AC85|nr:MFS transporter [Lentzea terrae]
MFGSLGIYNYRLYASGQIISLVGVWMQRVAQDWLVLELTNSPVALGIAASLQFLPVLLFSMWGGVLADRMDKRKLLLWLESALGICALVLGLLDVTGVVELWHVFVLCFLLGCFSAVETPVRQSFVVEMVGRESLTNAVAINSMMFNLARIVGPAIAGVTIVAIGTGWVFLANAISFVGVVLGIWLMRTSQLLRSDPVPREKGQLLSGLRYVRGRPDLLTVMLLVFFIATFGMNFYMTLAIMARNVFGGDADAYGLLSTLIAVGTFAGATWAARRKTPRMSVFIGAGVVFGLLEIVSGLMPTMLLTGLMMIPVGVAMMTFNTTANATIQLAVEPEMRGRVMGVYMLVFLGGNPVGGPLMGWLGEINGRAPIIVGGVVSVLVTVTAWIILVRRGDIGKPRLRRRTAEPVSPAELQPSDR